MRRVSPATPLRGPVFLDTYEREFAAAASIFIAYSRGVRTLERTVRTMLIINPSPGIDLSLGVLD